ncbi:hypothetical protein ALT785_530016 [Alteromonas infernus]
MAQRFKTKFKVTNAIAQIKGQIYFCAAIINANSFPLRTTFR